MCIRDSDWYKEHRKEFIGKEGKTHRTIWNFKLLDLITKFCLLYTSDAADERSSVDLGGRRIIKKKNNMISAYSIIIDRAINYVYSMTIQYT